MRIINEYEVEIFKDASKENTFVIKNHEVGLENDRFIVLKNEHFTTLNKNKRGGHSLNMTLDDTSIHTRKWKYLPDYDGIVYHLFTEKTKKPEQIRKEIAAFIEKEYGYLTAVNLDFIK